MRRGLAVSVFVFLCAVAATLSGCGGGWGLKNSRGSTRALPSLDDLRLDPRRVVENGKGATDVIGTFYFVDEGTGVSECLVEVFDPSGTRISRQALRLRNVSRSGTRSATVAFRMPTPTPGTFTVRVNVTDLLGRASNVLTRTFDVVASSPLVHPWTRAAPMPTPRVGLGAAAIGGRLYAVGGEDVNDLRNIVECYDPGTGTWTTRTPMPTPRSRFASVVIDDKMYVMGGIGRIASSGRGETTAVEQYDPATDTWMAKAAMPAAQWDFGAVVIAGRIFAVGGAIPGTGTMFYDPGTDTWVVLPPPATNTAAFAAGVIDDRLYIAGGIDQGITARVERYNPAVNSWAGRSPMPDGRAHATSDVVNGKMYVIGGISGETRHTAVVRDTTESYDPVTDTWAEKAPMPTARSHAASCVIDGKIYVVGGFEAYLSRPGNRVEVYDPSAEQ